MSKVNRYAYLLGGINSISYGFIYLYYNIPGSAISAFLFSCPLQIISFIRWSKTSWKKTTVLKKMSPRIRIFNAVVLVAVWAVYYAIIRYLGSASSLIDSLGSLLGIYITLLQMFKYSEYTVLMIPSGLLNISLYISLISQGSIEQVPFLIYSCYSLLCVIRSVFNAKKIIKEQEAEIQT
jgi:nicotinamide riboside transporter PnuC